MGETALEFLAGLALGDKYAPGYLLSPFELKRLSINGYGRIVEQTHERAQMIISSIVVIRVFVYQLMMRAKEWSKQVYWNQNYEINFKILASLTYRIVLEIWTELLPIVNHSIKELNIEPMPALAIDGAYSIPDSDEIVQGLYSD